MLTDDQFADRGLAELYRYGAPRPDSVLSEPEQRAAVRRMDALASATSPGDLRLPGYDLRPERGGGFSVALGGGSRLRFRWYDDRAQELDIEPMED